MEYIEYLPYALAALWAISEVLAEIPQVKANSVFQATRNGLKKLMELTKKKTK